jgi:hypothetical protein
MSIRILSSHDRSTCVNGDIVTIAQTNNTLAMDNRSTYMSFKEGRQRMVVKEGVGG